MVTESGEKKLHYKQDTHIFWEYTDSALSFFAFKVITMGYAINLPKVNLCRFDLY